MTERWRSEGLPSSFSPDTNDIDKSFPDFSSGDSVEDRGVVLRDWSAQDFANIYVRFRPLLISHARRYLKDLAQAEEIVQDAFLYLMTALPELDSELGVLRFLKWKTKMLCLDVLRSSHSRLRGDFVPLPDDLSYDAQPQDFLERAEDAAIIRMALAKLNPRHREALIATIYEEKSHEEVALQMGVGANAFRQLLHRAKASFKAALVGEASLEGKSVSEVLFAASDRFSAGAIKKLPALSVALLAASLTWSLFQGIPRSDDVIVPVAGQVNISDIESPGVVLDDDAARPTTQEDPIDPTRKSEVNSDELLESQESSVSAAGSLDESTLPSSSEDPEIRPELELLESKQTVDLITTRRVLDASQFAAIAETEYRLVRRDYTDSGSVLVLASEGSLKATIGIGSGTSDIIQFSWFELAVEDYEFAMVPREIVQIAESKNASLDCRIFLFTDFVVGDTKGNLGALAFKEATLSDNAALLDLCIAEDGQVRDTRLRFSNRS